MTTPPDHPSDDDAERAVDRLAQRAGASLRRPPPEDGPRDAMNTGARIRRRRAIGAVAGVAVLALGTVALVRRDDSSSDPIATPAPTTASSPSPTTAATSTTAAVSTTTAAPTTTSLADRLNQWALDYTGGSGGSASGEPIRIGVADLPIEPMQASVDYLNAELGGIGGRPVELDICEWTDASRATSCGSRFANDPTIMLVISGLNPDFLTALGTSKPRFGGVVQNEQGIISYGLQPGISSVVTLAKVAREQAGPEAKKVVLFSFGGLEPLFTPWLDGLEMVSINWIGLDTDGLVTALNAAGAADADAFMLVGLEDQCNVLQGALDLLKVSPVVVTNLCQSPVEGWYYVDQSYNVDDPSYETGAATAVAKLEQYGVKPRDCGFCDDPYNFADVLTAAKIITSIGGPDAATPDVLGQALLDFKGPAMITGDQDCSLLTNPDPTKYLQPLSCQKTFNLEQVRNGKYVELEPIDVTTP